ncbi:uncharacterized protein DFL_007098 [Arthrobotrys flagrans]|uniref:Uncharacterized protein n=1 Tax=Arthrobotrys flagrans TaxID=97331 RepID=A0A436ZUT4_ARTFL|nr:hypothetical protein DFL_007098 [Arthrobotrys flagrans]
MHLFIANTRGVTETIFIGALIVRQLSPTAKTQDYSTCASLPGWPMPKDNGGYFDRASCWNRTKPWLQNETSKALPNKCIKLLFWDATTENTTLTRLGCNEFCGRDQGCLSLPAIGWDKFLAIMHAMGDPIDSVWSLLDKIYAWDKCYAFAEEFVTEEQSFGESLMKTTEFDEWRRAATTLVDDRTNDLVRTAVAIALFIFQFFSSLVFDSDKVPPGGRLGSAMLLSWLIPLMLISNIMEGVASRRTFSGLLSAWLKIYGAVKVACQIKGLRVVTGTTTLISYIRPEQSIYLVRTNFK